MKMIKLWLVAMILPCLCFSQNVWTLERCIQHAYEQNISIKQFELSERLAENNLLQSKLSLLPVINFNANHSFNFGNAVDPTTFEFVQANTQSSAFSLTGSVPLFTGLQQLNGVKRSKLELEASKADLDEMKQSIALTVTSFYLQVLLNKEIYQSSLSQYETTQEQLKQTRKLIEAGVLPQADALDIEAQLANDELRLVNGENNVMLSKLSLKLLLQLDGDMEFDVAEPTFEIPESVSLADLTPRTILSDAFQFRPEIKAAQLRLQSAERSLAIAKGSLSPTLSMSGSITTNYFSETQEVIAENMQTIPSTEIGFLEDDPTKTVLSNPTSVSIPQFGKTSFADQLPENRRESIGINLSVPIFQGWSRMTNIDNSKIGIMNAAYELESRKNTLSEEIYQAHANAVAASKTYQSNLKNKDAQEMSYRNASERYEVGALNAFDFQTIKNNLAISESNLLQAKYDYIFRLKILDFYQGKQLTMN